jgi:ATP adenylyltransferase
MTRITCEEKLLDKTMKNTDQNCVLCEMLRNTEENETFVAQLEYGSLFLHRNQCYVGRCLYVSNIHVENYPNIDYDLFMNLNRELLFLCKMMKRTFQPDLINYASLGIVIEHFHYHIIPRYKDDPNWGGPPWPSIEKRLTKNEYQKLAALIRISLEEYEGEGLDFCI